jgi:hypothetical protein
LKHAVIQINTSRIEPEFTEQLKPFSTTAAKVYCLRPRIYKGQGTNQR